MHCGGAYPVISCRSDIQCGYRYVVIGWLSNNWTLQQCDLSLQLIAATIISIILIISVCMLSVHQGLATCAY